MKVSKQRELAKMRIILPQLEPCTDQAVPTRTIDQVPRPEPAFAGLNGDSVRVEINLGDLDAARDPAPGFGCVTETNKALGALIARMSPEPARV